MEQKAAVKILKALPIVYKPRKLAKDEGEEAQS
jgi:hypothetical protein